MVGESRQGEKGYEKIGEGVGICLIYTYTRTHLHDQVLHHDGEDDDGDEHGVLVEAAEDVHLVPDGAGVEPLDLGWFGCVVSVGGGMKGGVSLSKRKTTTRH